VYRRSSGFYEPTRMNCEMHGDPITIHFILSNLSVLLWRTNPSLVAFSNWIRGLRSPQIIDLSVRQLNPSNLLDVRKRLRTLLGVNSKRSVYFNRVQILAPPTVDKPPSDLLVYDCCDTWLQNSRNYHFSNFSGGRKNWIIFLLLCI